MPGEAAVMNVSAGLLLRAIERTAEHVVFACARPRDGCSAPGPIAFGGLPMRLRRPARACRSRSANSGKSSRSRGDGRIDSPPNPVHPLRHIHGEADARLLAVADDVDPGLELAGQHVGDRGRALAVQESLVDLFSGLLAQQQVGQMRRPRQAAAMGREDAVVAAQHGRPILCLLLAALNPPGGYSPSR